MNRNDFKVLADTRIVEAKALLDQGHWSGAFYLAGYAVECGLKACIAKLTKADDFPDKGSDKFYTHVIEKLVELAGLKPARDVDADPKVNPAKSSNWSTVKDWSEASRYQLKSEADAKGLYAAITDPTDGVLPWIRSRW